MPASDIPDNWAWRTLGDPDVCSLNPRKSDLNGLADDINVTFVPMCAVDEVSGTIRNAEQRKLGQVRKGYTYFAEGDVVFAKITPCMENGKSAIARNLTNGIGFGTTEFHVLRPGPKVIAEWLHAFIRRAGFREAARSAMYGAAGQQRVPSQFLAESKLPIPSSLDEQRRIIARIGDLATCIEKARGIHRKAVDEATSYPASLYHSMYGRLMSEYETVPLEEAGKTMGGGTPSKNNSAFWKGEIPWVAPKYMKRWRIADSPDRVSQAALESSSARLIPPPAVLFVVRGMILVRNVPVAISSRPLTINQDMKAIVPRKDIDAVFLASMMRGAEAILLGRVEVAGHGTRKLRTERWASLPIPVPPMSIQEDVVETLEAMHAKARRLMELQTDIDAELASFMPALLAKAFRGEL